MAMIHPDKLFGRLGNRLFQMAYIHAQMLDGSVPDIYVQDPKYFDHHADAIKASFSNGIEPIDQVAIHVRRGDYVGNPFYVDLYNTTDYYERAMELFPDADFLVFSDDIAWCKKQEIFKGCEFSEGNDEVIDLNLMAGCNGQIIANSSYSWWGAYLSPFTKKVVYPSKWFSDGVTRVGFPKEWLCL